MDNTAFFYSLLRTPHLLTKEEVKQLLALEAKYPFFQGVQLLVAANAEALSKNVEEVVMRRSRAAIALPDAFALFRYRDAMRLNLLREQKEAAEKNTASAVMLPTVSSITTTNEKNELAGVLEHSLQSVVPFPAAALYTLETTEHLGEEEIYLYTTTHLNPRYSAPAASDTFAAREFWHPVTPEEQMELINNFLQNLNAEDGIKATVQREAEEEERMGLEPEDLSAASRSVTHSTTMERVAKLHESFAEYESAIHVYEKLVQTFPEKSTYFAKEIERLSALLERSND
jgi:hypothetical protein